MHRLVAEVLPADAEVDLRLEKYLQFYGKQRDTFEMMSLLWRVGVVFVQLGGKGKQLEVDISVHDESSEI